MIEHGRGTEDFLDTAGRIGEAICRGAYWDKTRQMCNWIGHTVNAVTLAGGPVIPTVAALSPGVYNGSAGIAVFLAQLYAFRSDPAFRTTAIGAIRRSVRQLSLDSSSDLLPASFFSGATGVAYAAYRVGMLTHSEELHELVLALMEKVLGQESRPRLLDVMGGSAGAIPAFLILSRALDRKDFIEFCEVLGKDIEENAVQRGDDFTWETEKACGFKMSSSPLTGFAHGAAGIGLALFELYAATGRTTHLKMAEGAFAYEDSLFDSKQGNWPDLREVGQSDAGSSRSRFAVAWCHGAPGIALTRLRAAVLNVPKKSQYLATARVGLSTTVRGLENALGQPGVDATLCHGLAGLSEVVLTAGLFLQDESYLRIAATCGGKLTQVQKGGYDWPSGVPSGGPNPSLFLGTAGIGYHLLRLFAPREVPPVLVLVS